VLNQEGGKLGLRDYRELWISAADVPLPVGVLRRVGCWKVGMWVVRKMNAAFGE